MINMDISQALNAQWNLTSCWCQECCKQETGYYNLVRMVLCPECGNKRCPKATSCKLECTNSNEPGQKGSIY